MFISQNDTAFEAAINASGVAEFVCAVRHATEKGLQQARALHLQQMCFTVLQVLRSTRHSTLHLY